MVQIGLSIWFEGFSLSFKVDSENVKVGGLVIKSVVGNLRLSLPHFTHFPTKVDSLDLKVAGFSAGCRHLMRTLDRFRFLFHLTKLLFDRNNVLVHR